MEIYHLFTTGNGNEYRGWCSRYILPLCVQEEGFLWSDVRIDSPYRMSGEGWKAVKAGRLTEEEKTLCGGGWHWQRDSKGNRLQHANSRQQ